MSNLATRRLESIKNLANEIRASGGQAEAAELDALDEKAIESHLDSVIAETGKVDVSFNAVGVPASLVAEKGMQGLPLTDIPLESFTFPSPLIPAQIFSPAGPPCGEWFRKRRQASS